MTCYTAARVARTGCRIVPYKHVRGERKTPQRHQATAQRLIFLGNSRNKSELPRTVLRAIRSRQVHDTIERFQQVIPKSTLKPVSWRLFGVQTGFRKARLFPSRVSTPRETMWIIKHMRRNVAYMSYTSAIFVTCSRVRHNTRNRVRGVLSATAVCS
jgi:hypothetical protein